jgi:hypothetical protein
MESASERPEQAPAQCQPSESHAIRRLTAFTCILAVLAAATGFVFVFLETRQENRIIRASQLAEDRLELLTRDDGALREPNATSEKEVIVLPGVGERYRREVTIDPGVDQGRPARITVTVAWETISGESRVRMYRRLDSGDESLTDPPRPARTRDLRGALAP